MSVQVVGRGGEAAKGGWHEVLCGGDGVVEGSANGDLNGGGCVGGCGEYADGFLGSCRPMVPFIGLVSACTRYCRGPFLNRKYLLRLRAVRP